MSVFDPPDPPLPDEDPIDYCGSCGVVVVGYEPQMCCDGFECGCMGKPIEPCWCEDCWDLWTRGSEK